MPVPQDWCSSPLQTVASIFETRDHQPNWEQRVVTHFKEQISQDGPEKIVSLNEAANHDLNDGQLVRFRCLVQDMFDPEFYLAEYKVRSLADGTVRTVTGRYRDTLSCSPREEVLQDDSSAMAGTGDRLSFYCTSIPGEAAWVTEKFSNLRATSGEVPPGPSGVQSNPLKRGRDLNEGESMETEEVEMNEGPSKDVENNKKPRSNGDSAPNGSSASNTASPSANQLNLPLGGRGKAAVVKMYDLPEGEIKLNDMLELVGILSLDPALAGSQEEEGEMMSPCVPPPSLVPRLHVLTFTKLQQDCPRLEYPSGTELESTRGELLAVLTECMLGDKLAAEYLLCHLLARVYLRKDVLVLGKLSLNLHNMTQHDNWPRRLSTVLSLLTTNSHFLPLTRETLDSANFIPSKDFEANRLVTGLLQLPAGMNLFVDETVMTDGQLTAKGLKNLTALGSLITWQKVDYDFKFQQMEFESDVACLVMSEGRSMLPSDSQLMVKPDCMASPDIISTKFRGVGQYLTSSLLDRIRAYISGCRAAEYNLTDEVMKRVQDDFVAMRQQEGGMTVEDFHSLLVLARLVSISNGRTSLDPSDWEKAKEMEKERKQRADTLPPRGGANFANGMPMHLNSGES